VPVLLALCIEMAKAISEIARSYSPSNKAGSRNGVSITPRCAGAARGREYSPVLMGYLAASPYYRALPRPDTTYPPIREEGVVVRG
jgi:hypothetical protein